LYSLAFSRIFLHKSIPVHYFKPVVMPSQTKRPFYITMKGPHIDFTLHGSMFNMVYYFGVLIYYLDLQQRMVEQKDA
jgi:hypothetical protein